MKAMILAAGGANRLYPLTYSLPKALVPVLNAPVIEHIIALLSRHGFRDIIINIHYLHRLLEERIGDGSRFGVTLQYSFEPELLGTAGGVRNVRDQLTETFLVIGADDLTDLDLTALLEAHRQKGAIATVAVAPTQQASEVGVLDMDPEGRVTFFQEKPTDGQSQSWCNTGVYVFEPEIFEHIPDTVGYDFGKNLFPSLVEKKLPFYAYRAGEAFWMDIGSHVSYRQANWQLLEGQTGLRVPGTEIRPHVWVEEDATVSPQAYLRPPVLIGRGARVEAGVELTGPVVLGANVTVKQGAKIRRSVLWSRCTVGNNAVVEDSLVGSDSLLSSHSTTTGQVLASGSRPGADERESHD